MGVLATAGVCVMTFAGLCTGSTMPTMRAIPNAPKTRRARDQPAGAQAQIAATTMASFSAPRSMI
jgi:hypothetical protein